MIDLESFFSIFVFKRYNPDEKFQHAIMILINISYFLLMF